MHNNNECVVCRYTHSKGVYIECPLYYYYNRVKKTLTFSAKFDRGYINYDVVTHNNSLLYNNIQFTQYTYYVYYIISAVIEYINAHWSK